MEEFASTVCLYLDSIKWGFVFNYPTMKANFLISKGRIFLLFALVEVLLAFQVGGDKLFFAEAIDYFQQFESIK